jgi:hypothetical protein
MGKDELTYDEFKKLLNGENIIKRREIFKVDWQELNVKIT